MKNLYMHTIYGKPAVYIPDRQIVYFNGYQKVDFDEVFVDSLKKIRNQQLLSAEWRKRNGMSDNFDSKYGYIRIRDNRGAK